MYFHHFIIDGFLSGSSVAHIADQRKKKTFRDLEHGRLVGNTAKFTAAVTSKSSIPVCGIWCGWQFVDHLAETGLARFSINSFAIQQILWSCAHKHL